MVFIGIGLASAGKVWKTAVQREKEEELLFRGDQIVKGLESYYSSGHGGVNFLPRKLEDLIKDNRFLNIKRHIRKIYKDPMTEDGEWDIIRDESGRIKGVRSKSDKEPLKKKGFPYQYRHFENKNRYSEWEFVFTPKKN
ncbi:MAG: type II secretion system protein [Proteobacteria bacterium]|nr:type II secretion system protein [Pseudomonadota bacterium]